MKQDVQVTLSGNGVNFVVTYFPYRKKLCLGILEGNVLTKIATFNSEYSAGYFLEKMQEMLGLYMDEVSEDVKETIRELKTERGDAE